jgi:hypothetical protein
MSKGRGGGGGWKEGKREFARQEGEMTQAFGAEGNNKSCQEAERVKRRQ